MNNVNTTSPFKRLKMPQAARTSNRRRGATTVEMAIVMPVFVLILFGFFEIGHAFMIDSISENAAYEGARRGIVPGATEESARKAAEDIAIASSLQSIDVQVTRNEISPGVHGITVTVTAPMSQNAIFAGPFLGDMTISRSVSMIHESSLRFLFPPGERTFPEPTPRPRGRGK